jgi:hypothetical protein
MMVPEERRRCSAAEFASSWLAQQQAKAKQAEAGRRDWQDAPRMSGRIHAGRDQGALLVGAT